MSLSINLLGQKFGKLTVIEKDIERTKKKSSYWFCKCECGNTKSIRHDMLRKKGTKSCGCDSKYNLVGLKVGFLTVIKKLGQIKNIPCSAAYWECLCECGNTVNIATTRLTGVAGITKSCGCYRRSFKRDNCKKHAYGVLPNYYWHRLIATAKQRRLKFTVTPEYINNLWEKQGGKCALSGVDINLPKKSTDKKTASLDRKNSKKGYSKGNVQWIHKTVNLMKNNIDEKVFIKFCENIATNLKT